MSPSFSGKTAIVTGSAGGLGKAIAKAYLDAGAQVVLCDINEPLLKEAETELSSNGTVFAHPVDITNEASVTSLVKAVVEKFGKIDILVNNAGVVDKFGKPDEDSRGTALI
jgi:NAD(P)-dependent dehydrogenase (short-subunit alcohol dehydrogenase family)